jgi:hypothetical protein
VRSQKKRVVGIAAHPASALILRTIEEVNATNEPVYNPGTSCADIP